MVISHIGPFLFKFIIICNYTPQNVIQISANYRNLCMLSEYLYVRLLSHNFEIINIKNKVDSVKMI